MNRRAGANGGAAFRLRLDDQIATDQLQAFHHASQAESRATTRRIDVEANAFITNGEVDGVPSSAKMDIEMPGSTVPYSVVQGFLKDSEETERNVGRHTARDVLVAEINPNVLLPREFLTETPHRGHNAQMQQPWRV